MYWPKNSWPGKGVWRWWFAVQDFLWGIRYGMPICCVAAFALDVGRGRRRMAARRGACVNYRGLRRDPQARFVPCGVIHVHDPAMPPEEKPQKEN